MKSHLLIFLFSPFFIILAESFLIFNEKSFQSINNDPIIGVLTQEMAGYMGHKYSNQYKSYIAASYVKFIEGAGARCVPIWIGRNDSYYEDIMSKINGVLLPGGAAAKFNDTNGYGGAGDRIRRIAKKYNDNGDYFPIFGTCLGFELLVFLSTNRASFMTRCDSYNHTLPLIFSSGYKNSKMFKNAPSNVIKILRTENVTANYHIYCITKSDLDKVHLADEYTVLSTSYDKNGLEYISAIEDRKYPFYGVQFHPEKNVYEWIEGRELAHGKNPTIVNQYFANFFVDEARKSLHKFQDKTEEINSLIYNYPVMYKGLNDLPFVQYYLFNT
ncbi:gamma-glutamyl hydrolase A-like [Leptopilina heterotoma]|uniref:gamma-glutamyl hydrolase A-like n=1 Tax=Leptopilina heterotoma TaxID=63436 RepID=UPI001CA7ED92|nr:gamma-glutamyl hydrolase A-like [Leptopilina heterotoma]